MKKLIAYSLFGTAAKYSSGMVANILQAAETFPGWDLRVYVEEGHFLIAKLEEMDVQVVQRSKVGGSGGMFWRYEAFKDQGYSHVISRDADSALSKEDFEMVDCWIKSGKAFHRIVSHPAHRDKELMGGLIGVRPAYLKEFDIPENLRNKEYGDDENWLQDHLFPVMGEGLLTSTPDFTPSGFVGEQLPVRVFGSSRVVLVSAKHYSNQRLKFLKKYYSHASDLGECEVEHGWNRGEHVIPDSFEKNDSVPHYYLATQTHIDVLEKAILEDLDHLFVFEDDAVLTGDTLENLGRALSALPGDARGLWAGGYGGTSRYIPGILDHLHGFLGAHAYYLNKEGMRDMFHWLKRWSHLVVDQVFHGHHCDIPLYYALPEDRRIGVDQDHPQWGAGS